MDFPPLTKIRSDEFVERIQYMYVYVYVCIVTICVCVCLYYRIVNKSHVYRFMKTWIGTHEVGREQGVLTISVVFSTVHEVGKK